MKTIRIGDLKPHWQQLAREEGRRSSEAASSFCLGYLPSTLTKNQICKRAMSMGVSVSACYQWRCRAGITEDKRQKAASNIALKKLKNQIVRKAEDLEADRIAFRVATLWNKGKTAVESTGEKNPPCASGKVSKLRDKYGEILFPRRRDPRRQ